MHVFIHYHHQLGIGHPKTHPKTSDSILANVHCSRLYCHLLNFLTAVSQFLDMNVCYHRVHMSMDEKVLEPPYLMYLSLYV